MVSGWGAGAVRRVLWVVAVLAAVVSTVLVSAPAHAAAPAIPSVSGLSTNVPGHLTGTVASAGATYVMITGESAGKPQSTPSTKVVLAGGPTPFDIPTWGLSGTSYLRVDACTEGPTPEDLPTCTGGVYLSASFVPKDIVPSVVFSGDTTIGPGQSVSVTADDQGGGILAAEWRYNNLPYGERSQLDQHGTTEIQPTLNGPYELVVVRCASLGGPCASFSPKVAKLYQVYLYAPLTNIAVAPVNLAHPTTALLAKTVLHGQYDVHWTLTSGPWTQVLSGDVLDQPIGSDGTLTAPIDGSTLADGSYTLHATATIRDPDFGTFADQSIPDMNVQVDRVPPEATLSVQRPTIYPQVADARYPASTTISVTGADVVSVMILSGTTAVRTLPKDGSPIAWNGRYASGALAPAGAYTVVAVDQAGNPASATGQVSVSPLRKVAKTWTKIVSARGSMEDRYVGRCSTLRNPSARRWRGSLGYYANTRCGTQTAKASAVQTLHVAYAPAGYEYRSIRVDVYGGPARGRPKNRAVMGYVNNRTGEILRSTVVKGPVGWHQGTAIPTRDALFRDRSFGWVFGTAYRNRYDVAKFKLTVAYYVLTTS